MLKGESPHDASSTAALRQNRRGIGESWPGSQSRAAVGDFHTQGLLTRVGDRQ